MLQWWDANRFYVIKVKSHRHRQDATSDADCYNIWGNSFADEAAVQTRKQDLACFDHLRSNVRTHYGNQQNHVPRLWKYMLDVAYLRMLKEEDDAKDHKDPPIGLTRQNAGTENQVNTDAHATPLEARLQTNARWTVTGDTHPLPPEPHQVVFWSCTWGINITRLVWQYLLLLKWPPAASHPQRSDVGISWVELAISFMLWSGSALPVKIRTDKGWRDPKVQMQPPAHRSLRNVAESFRWVVKHLQTFSQTKFIPSYRKQGSKSLVALGFSTDHEGGLACRPEPPNGLDTYKYVRDLLLVMPCNPPFHTNVPLLPLQTYTQAQIWPTWNEADYDKQQKFQICARNALRTKKNLDTLNHPDHY